MMPVWRRRDHRHRRRFDGGRCRQGHFGRARVSGRLGRRRSAGKFRRLGRAQRSHFGIQLRFERILGRRIVGENYRVIDLDLAAGERRQIPRRHVLHDFRIERRIRIGRRPHRRRIDVAVGQHPHPHDHRVAHRAVTGQRTRIAVQQAILVIIEHFPRRILVALGRRRRFPRHLYRHRIRQRYQRPSRRRCWRR